MAIGLSLSTQIIHIIQLRNLQSIGRRWLWWPGVAMMVAACSGPASGLAVASCIRLFVCMRHTLRLAGTVHNGQHGVCFQCTLLTSRLHFCLCLRAWFSLNVCLCPQVCLSVCVFVCLRAWFSMNICFGCLSASHFCLSDCPSACPARLHALFSTNICLPPLVWLPRAPSTGLSCSLPCLYVYLYVCLLLMPAWFSMLHLPSFACLYGCLITSTAISV